MRLAFEVGRGFIISVYGCEDYRGNQVYLALFYNESPIFIRVEKIFQDVIYYEPQVLSNI